MTQGSEKVPESEESRKDAKDTVEVLHISEIDDELMADIENAEYGKKS